MTAPKRYNRILFTAAGALLLAAFGISLLIGAYPLTAQDIPVSYTHLTLPTT